MCVYVCIKICPRNKDHNYAQSIFNHAKYIEIVNMSALIVNENCRSKWVDMEWIKNMNTALTWFCQKRLFKITGRKAYTIFVTAVKNN